MATLKRFGPALLALALLIATLAWAMDVIRVKRQIRKAKDELQQGFAMLAAQRLDPIRESVLGQEAGCSLLMMANYAARRAEPLEWAAQACLASGVNTVEVPLALAGAREFTGRESDAAIILNQAIERFGDIPELLVRLARLYAKLRDNDGAVATYLRASNAAGQNVSFPMEALQYLSGTERWKEARAVADRLRTAPIEDPNSILLIARALKKGGDEAGASALADRARTKLELVPAQRARLEAAYPEFLRKN